MFICGISVYIAKKYMYPLNMECGVIGGFITPGQLLDIEFEFTLFIGAN